MKKIALVLILLNILFIATSWAGEELSCSDPFGHVKIKNEVLSMPVMMGFVGGNAEFPMEELKIEESNKHVIETKKRYPDRAEYCKDLVIYSVTLVISKKDGSAFSFSDVDGDEIYSRKEHVVCFHARPCQ